MFRSLACLALVAALSLLCFTGCASATTKAAAAKPLVPGMQDEAERAPVDNYLDDVKKNAAEQLECPIEQVNVVCMRRDSEGGCISVKADGCDRTYEYQFGD